MTPEDQLLEIARGQRIGVFFDGKARRAGLPWVIFKKSDLVLAEFYDPMDALRWFPKPVCLTPPKANGILSLAG